MRDLVRFLQHRSGRMIGSEVKRYSAHPPHGLGESQVLALDWILLKLLEYQAAEFGSASVRLGPSDNPNPLIVLHKSHQTWENQEEDYKDGDYIYRVEWGRGPSKPIPGRLAAAHMLARRHEDEDRQAGCTQAEAEKTYKTVLAVARRGAAERRKAMGRL